MILRYLPFVLMTLSGCSSEPKPSELKEIRMSLRSKGEAYLYVENNTVKFEQCVVDQSHQITERGKYCDNLEFNPVPLDFINYRDALAIAYGIDANIVVGGLESFNSTIANLEKRKDEELQKEEPSPRKIELIEEKLSRYLGSKAEVEQLFTFLAHLEDGKPLELDEDIDGEDIKRLLAPFYGKLPGTTQNFVESPETGLVYVEEPEMCWYDAMGINYVTPCLSNDRGDIFTRSIRAFWPDLNKPNRDNLLLSGRPFPLPGAIVRFKESDRGRSYLDTPVNFLVVDENLKEIDRESSCQAKYGKGWSVATHAQLQKLIYRENSIKLPKHVADGGIYFHGWAGSTRSFADHMSVTDKKELINYDFVLSTKSSLYQQSEKSEDQPHNSQATVLESFTDSLFERKHTKRLALGVVCVAPAKVANPYGDIDNDGIRNITDLCNRYPENLDAESAVSGDRIGCVPNQLLDSELDYFESPDAASIWQSELRSEKQFHQFLKYASNILPRQSNIKERTRILFEKLFGSVDGNKTLNILVTNDYPVGTYYIQSKYMNAMAKNPSLLQDADNIIDEMIDTLPSSEQMQAVVSKLISAENFAVMKMEDNSKPREVLSHLLDGVSEHTLYLKSSDPSQYPNMISEYTQMLVEKNTLYSEIEQAIKVFAAYKSSKTGEPLARCSDNECADHKISFSEHASPRYEYRQVTYRCRKPGSSPKSWIYASESPTRVGKYDYYMKFTNGTRGAWVEGHYIETRKCPSGYTMVNSRA